MGENDGKDPARGRDSDRLNLNPGNSFEENVNLHMLATTVVSLEPEMACHNCASLQENLNATYVELQSTKQQHVKTVATLKKKIISTDLLIREYQSQKNECEVLKRKIEEFACLVSQLDKDLTRYKAELMTALNELEPLKKADAERENVLEKVRKECELVRDQAAALKVTNDQLEAKVRQLESAETLAALDETKLNTLEKELKKVQRTAEQFKEEKTECRKKLATQRHEIAELRNKLRKAHKYAMTWGKLADKHGILVGANRRVFESWSQPKGDLLSTLDQDEEDGGNSSEEDALVVEDKNGGQLLETLLKQEDGQCEKEETSGYLVASLLPDTHDEQPPAIEKIIGTSNSLRQEVMDAGVTDRTTPTVDLSERVSVAKGDSGDLLTVNETIKEASKDVMQDNLTENVLLTVPHHTDSSSLDSQAPTLPGNSETPSLLTSPTTSADTNAYESDVTKITLSEDLLVSLDSQPLESLTPALSSGLLNFATPPSLQVSEDNFVVENLDLSSDEEEICDAPILPQLKQGSNQTVVFHDIQPAEICERNECIVAKSPVHSVCAVIATTEQLQQNSPPPLVQNATEPSNLPVSANLPQDIEESIPSSFPNNESTLEIQELSKNETRPSNTTYVENFLNDVRISESVKAPDTLPWKPDLMEAESLQESDAAVFKVPDLSLIPDIAPSKLLRPSDSHEKNCLPIAGLGKDRAPKPVSDLQSQKEELEEILRLMTADVPFLAEDDMITPLPPSPVPEISASPTPLLRLARPQTFHSLSVGFEPTLTNSDLIPASKLPTPTSDSIFEKISIDPVATKEELTGLLPDKVPKAKSASVRPACVFDWRGKKLEAKPNKGRPTFVNTLNKRKHRTQVPFLHAAPLRILTCSETYLPHRRSSVTNFAEAERKHVSKSRNFCETIPFVHEFFSSEDQRDLKTSRNKSSSVINKKKTESVNKHADLFGDSDSEEEIPPRMDPPPPNKLLRTLPQRIRKNAPRIHPVSGNLPARKTRVISIPAESREIPCVGQDSSSQKVSPVLEPIFERKKQTAEHEKTVLTESPEALAEEDMPPPLGRQRKARLNKANAVTSLEAPSPTMQTSEQEHPNAGHVEFVGKGQVSAPKTCTDTNEKFILEHPASKRKRGDFTEVSGAANERQSHDIISASVESDSTFPEAVEEFEATTNKLARLEDEAMLKPENGRKMEDLCTKKGADESTKIAQLTEISVEDVVNKLELNPSSVLPTLLEIDTENGSVMVGKPTTTVDEDGKESFVTKPLTLAERQRRKLERLVSAPFSSHVAESASEDMPETESQTMVEHEAQVESETYSMDIHVTNTVEEIASPPASPTPENEEIYKTVSSIQEIPLEPVRDSEIQHRLTVPVRKDTRPLMEIVKEKLAQKAGAKFTLHLKPSAAKAMKKSVRACLNKIAKAETLSPELVMETAERLTRRDVQADPYFAARHIVALLRKDETELQTAFMPPAPPLTTTQERMITVIQAIKKHPNMQEKNGPFYDPEMVVIKTIQDILLRSSSLLNSIPMYEMSALTRFVTALTRCRGDLGLMRTLWYDIMYFRPPQAYALTYVLLTVWPDVLRHSSFCLGPSPLEQTIVYLLTTCNAVKAVPGPEGKVIASRNLLKDAFGFQSTPAAGANELCLYLTEKVKECRSCDEMRSFASCFALLARWEGHTFGIRIVKEYLWPLLEEWSAGQGEDFAAATALLAIGWLGRSFATDGQEINKKILQVLKTLISQPENVSTVMQESIMETVILLGAQADKDTVCGLLKFWQPPRDVPVPLLDMMCAFVGSNRALIDDS